jgi:hypothetical protein
MGSTFALLCEAADKACRVDKEWMTCEAISQTVGGSRARSQLRCRDRASMNPSRSVVTAQSPSRSLAGPPTLDLSASLFFAFPDLDANSTPCFVMGPDTPRCLPPNGRPKTQIACCEVRSGPDQIIGV